MAWVLFERLGNHVVEASRNARIHRTGRIRRLMQDRSHQLGALRLWKGPPARGKLIQHSACRIDIAAKIHGKTTQLFGRHVRHRPGNRTRLPRNAESHVQISVRIDQLRQTKVHHLNALVGCNEYVGRLEVTMDDALVVCRR